MKKFLHQRDKSFSFVFLVVYLEVQVLWLLRLRARVVSVGPDEQSGQSSCVVCADTAGQSFPIVFQCILPIQSAIN